MHDHWLEINIRIPADAAELLGQELLEVGCTGIIVKEQPLDTFEVPEDIDPPAGEIAVRAYFPDTDDVGNLLIEIRKRLAQISRVSSGLIPAAPEVRRIATEDWATGWQLNFPPFTVGKRLVIRPSWSEWRPDGQQVVLTLDPGRAFGTGTHATTSLCLEILAQLVEGPTPPGSVLDVGTGSGILALAAAALGVRRVIACDIDPEACLVATENIHQNGFDDQITVTGTPLEDIPGRFDLVLANILAKENIRLGAALIDHLQPGGHLILSGILNEQEAEVAAAFKTLGMTLTSTDRRDEWSCLTCRHDG